MLQKYNEFTLILKKKKDGFDETPLLHFLYLEILVTQRRCIHYHAAEALDVKIFF